MRHPRAWSTPATSSGGIRGASRGTRDRGPVRLAVKGKAVDAAWRVERTRAHPLMRQGPGDPGPPVRSGRSGEIQAMRLLGAPLPSWGRRKKRRALPRTTQVRDQHSVGFLTEARTEVTEAILRGTRLSAEFLSTTVFVRPAPGRPHADPGAGLFCRLDVCLACVARLDPHLRRASA